ncbi:MAG: Asp-tRNA(Asn)/Glu-tRNA(Gln) amidotransferase subunit GatB [Candidatus Aenigmarchaeota archaeon]|nr:Asp-tRNA(Asn)/Glu-tRNA(Gln) amidotransferase subunit GatB [Candidatus Aenigmarchaeota archaeon]
MKVMIGLEIHVHLLTESKLFCRCSSNYDGKDPNSNTCPICLGFPGSKPAVNKKVIDSGIMIAKALNCRIAPEMFFSRKTYFYPDMAKNFQITQYEIPLSNNGYLEVFDKKIRIRRVHIEEDPAKLVHVGGGITSAQYVLADYNRSGAPMVEIVTEPDFIDTKEVREFLSKLTSILEHLEVFDASKEGSMRADANVSLEGGERAEVKNITGFANVEKALNYEIVRQKNLLQMGMKVQRETRHFDADTNTTVTLRKKELEEDYGYIFEPDLTMIEIGKVWVDKMAKQMPELPDQRIERFVKEYKIPERDAKVIVYVDKALADFFEACVKLFNKSEFIAKWIVTDLLKVLNWNGLTIRQSKITPKLFVEFVDSMDRGTITERFGKELIKELVPSGKSVRELIKEKGLPKKIDLESVIKEVIEENKKAVENYKTGNEKSIQFLIGQVLKKTKSSADPNKIREILKRLI